MTPYEIRGGYPTVGPDAREWGEPEKRLEEALEGLGVSSLGSSAGTVLMTGERDVWIEVEVEDTGVLDEAIALLPEDERDLWCFESIEEENGEG